MEGRSIIAASLALAGGVTAAIGSFLSWAEVSAGPVTERASGVSGWEGKATLIAAAVMIVASFRVFTGGFDALSSLRPAAFVGGLVAVGVGSHTALTAKDQLLDAAASDLPLSVVRDALDSGLLQLSLSVGLYAVIVGGALGMLGTLVSVGHREIRPAGSGSGLTGWSASAPPTAASQAVSPGLPPLAPPPSSTSPWATPPRPDERSDPTP